jgi:hypothetical protein
LRKLEHELREQAKAKQLAEWDAAEAERIEKLAQDFRAKYGTGGGK